MLNVLKICTKCGTSKPASEFGLRPDSKDGRRSFCFECYRAHRRSYASQVRADRDRDEDRTVPLRTCSRCGIEKPIDRFRFDPRSRSGHRKGCLDCTRTAWRMADAARRDRAVRKRIAAAEGFQKALESARETSEREKTFRSECEMRALKIKAEGLVQPEPKPTIGPIEAAIRDYRRAWRSISSLRKAVAS